MAKMERSTVEAYGGITIAIVTTVFPMTWWLRVMLLLGLAVIIGDLCYRSPWTIRLHSALKTLICLALLVVGTAIAWGPLREQYLKETAPTEAKAAPSQPARQAETAAPRTLVVPAPSKERTWVNTSLTFLDPRQAPIAPGASLSVNFDFVNVGNPPARKISPSSTISKRNHLLSAAEEGSMFSELRKHVPATITQNILGKGQGGFITLTTPRLNAEEAQGVLEGKLYIYFAGRVTYEDDIGRHETESCAIFWGESPVLHLCQSHNGPK